MNYYLSLFALLLLSLSTLPMQVADYFSAVDADDTSLVAQLLQSGIDPNIREAAHDRTPLMEALRVHPDRNNAEIIRLLVRNGRTDVNAQDRDGFSALNFAVEENHLVGVQELLCRHDIIVAEYYMSGKLLFQRPIVEIFEKYRQKIQQR